MDPPPYPIFAPLRRGAPGRSCGDCAEPLGEGAWWSDTGQAVLYLCGQCRAVHAHCGTLSQAFDTQARSKRR